MPDRHLAPAPVLEAGREFLDFTIQRVAALPEIRATAYEMLHRPTGAQVLHLHCDDRENLFAITFRTPPPDSTGVAHILEHSVLAGSRRYPVKDAFNHLLRGSLNTFINAFTAPDFTCYPVCSQVRADFYNLAAVYTDLVLRPLLRRETFLREGHHLEITDDGRLSVSGIVFNEMKGALSTPERVAQSTTLQGLFPDTPSGVESGGRPEEIPDLTYDQFREFHRRFYSAANARIFLYGDIPTGEHLEFLQAQLAGLGQVEVESAVPPQPRWDTPRRLQAEFPADEGVPQERRSIVNVAWLTTHAVDLQERLVLEVLEEALVGHPAALLRNALVRSGLGEDLSPTTGLHTWYRELPFVVGLRGADAVQAEAIERLTLETLEGIVSRGFARDLLEAAFHQVEFKGLEITRDPLPFPLVLLFRSLNTWLHDGDPLVPLSFREHVSALRRRWKEDPDLFTRAVERWLVRNPHRVTAVIAPRTTLASEREKRFTAQLALRRSRMTEAELEEVRRTARALIEDQRSGDDPENLSRLPRLRLDEIPREIERIPGRELAPGGVSVFEHDVFSNGIAYLDVVFDVSDVPEDLQPYLPLLGAAATGMGAAGLDYEAFATRKALQTGGVQAMLEASQRLDGADPVEVFILRARALKRNIRPMVEIVRDILVSGDLTDAARLREIVSEERNRLRAAVAPKGHLFSWRTAAAGLSRSAWRDEQWHGASQLRHMGTLAGSFEAERAGIQEKLERLRRWIFRRTRCAVNLTGDEDSLGALNAGARELIQALPEGGEVGRSTHPPLQRRSTGVAIPGEVCYVARVLEVPRYADPCAPQLWVLASHLRNDVFYKKIRVEGGAYGGMCLYDPLRGQLAMLSYRDPHLERTLEVYEYAVADFVREKLTAEDLRVTIIGAVGRLERPMDPAGRGLEALRRRLVGLTDDDRRRFREAVLDVDPGQLRRCAQEIVLARLPSALQAVYAPRRRIEEANQRVRPPFAIESLEPAGS